MNKETEKEFCRIGMLAVVLSLAWVCQGNPARDFGVYKAEFKDNPQATFMLPDGRELIRIGTQLHLPKGEKGYTYGNFTFSEPMVKKSNNAVTVRVKGVFKETLPGNRINVKAHLEVDCRITCSVTGQVSICYEYLNKGEDIFVEPIVLAPFNYELCKGKEWQVTKVQGQMQQDIWPAELVNKLYTADFGTGKPVELQITSGTMNTVLGKPVIYNLTDQGHLRFEGGASVSIFDYQHFAGLGITYDWKPFPKGSSFVIAAEIILPVGADILTNQIQAVKKEEVVNKALQQQKTEVILPAVANVLKKQSQAEEKEEIMAAEETRPIDVMAYEKENYQARPEIKNGTFYLTGQPAFLVGAWLDTFFYDGGVPFPIPEYKNHPAYNRFFDYEIAQEMGFGTCHPPITTFATARKLAPECPRLLMPGFKDMEKYYPTFIRNLRNLPLVVDYGNIGAYDVISERFGRKLYPFPDEAYQHNARWHQFVPFCPEHPVGREIYRTFWQDGVRKIINAGGNPWIYELFNEPSYDCRCQYNRDAFITRLKEKYGRLDNVNQKWRSGFKSFEEIVADTAFERQPGLWVDWSKFIEDRWLEVLKYGMETIREIDKRDKVYFSSQRNCAKSLLSTELGYDEYKNARVLDVVNTEGGVFFGVGGRKPGNDNPMEEHLRAEMRMQLDIARAAAEGKPVIDTEQSTTRLDENGKRLPSHRDDLLIMLWSEAIHGSSSAQMYCWTKRLFDWPSKDLKGAEALVNKIATGWARQALLNPYCYPLGTLDAVKDFDGEMERLAEVVLPYPRVKGRVALLLSNPSRRYTRNIQGEFTVYYNALMATHYPFDIIYEEQINKGWAERYKAIVSPYARYVYPETLENLKKYVEKGGVVVAHDMDLAYDEYGSPVDTTGFLGIKRSMLAFPLPGKLLLSAADGYPQELEVMVKVNAAPVRAKVLGSLKKEGLALLTRNTVGKGQVYYFAGETKGLYLTSLLHSIFANARIAQPFRLRRIAGAILPQVEAQVIDRGDTRLYYFVNWNRISELGKLRIEYLPGGSYYLCDAVSSNLYLGLSGREEWSAGEIAQGVNVFLPAEERVLLLVSRARPKWAAGNMTSEEIKAKYQERRRLDEAAERELEERKKMAGPAYEEKNSYLDAVEKNCFPVDISRHCNMGFVDEVAGDGKGGAFDHGANNDLRGFPVGRRKFSKVPFNIIDPMQNGGRSMIVLRGHGQDYFPLEVKGIPVNRKAKYLYFLHATAWDGGKFNYIINYEDGVSEEIEIRGGEQVNGWWNPSELKAPQAKIGWEGTNLACHGSIGVYCYRWENPRKEIPIKSIDIKSFNLAVVPAMLGITGEEI